MKRYLTLALALTAMSSLTLEAQALDLDTPKVELRHGFRMGYTYGNQLDRRDHIKSPHMSALGYELTQTVESGVEGFRFIAIQNVLLSGLEQGLFLPSLTAMVGYEVFGIAQMGIGANLGALGPRLIIAAGLTPEVGNFQLPVHVHYIPDPDRNWRIGFSTGINF